MRTTRLATGEYSLSSEGNNGMLCSTTKNHAWSWIGVGRWGVSTTVHYGREFPTTHYTPRSRQGTSRLPPVTSRLPSVTYRHGIRAVVVCAGKAEVSGIKAAKTVSPKDS